MKIRRQGRREGRRARGEEQRQLGFWGSDLEVLNVEILVLKVIILQSCSKIIILHKKMV